MNRFVLLMLSILAIGSILWVTLFGVSGRPPKKKKPRPKRVRTVQPKRKLRIAGHVQTKDGTPVKGATVFVLPKQRRGMNRDEADHEVTGEDGRWSLYTKKTVGCWIGVVAPGYRNAWLDGDTVDPSVQMFLVVERAEAIRVTLTDEAGKPLRGQGVQVVPWPDSGAFYFLPGPKARQGEQWGVTDDAGRASFRRGDRGAISIRPHSVGRHAGGAGAWLPRPRGDVAFTMRPMATVELQLRGAASKAALAGLVTVEFFDPELGTPYTSFTETTTTPGVLRLERALPAGRYGVQVELEDHAPWILPSVEIPDAPEPHRIDVPLAAAGAPATLALELSGNAAALPAGARRRAPLTFLWRTDGSWTARQWRPGAPDTWDAAQRGLTFALPAGTYDVLIADVLTGRSALERGVRLQPGKTLERTVAMQPGQRGRLPTLEVEGTVARELIVTDMAQRRLPVFGSTTGGRIRAANSLDAIARALDGKAIYLGPYPVDEFNLELVRPGGKSTRITFR